MKEYIDKKPHSGYGYDHHSYSYHASKRSRNNYADDVKNVEQAEGYKELLSEMRHELIANHSDEIRDAVGKTDGQDTLKVLIRTKLDQKHRIIPGLDIDELTERLYEDMFSYSIVTPLLADPDVQEINCNRWDDIKAVTTKGIRVIPKSKGFMSMQQAVDVTKRMTLMGGLVLDVNTPTGDSYITEGVRIHAKVPPVIDADDGVHFSIRKQRLQKFTEKELIGLGTATEEMLKLLTMCVTSGVSVAFCGNTGSGKTTDVDWLLSTLPDIMRVVTIEDTREISMRHVDKVGNQMNNVMPNVTRYSDNNQVKNIGQRELARDALRCNPDLLVMAEMRGAEAQEVMEAARTGITVMSTFHAKNASDAYTRIASMAMMAKSGFSENMLLHLAYQSFPIICHKKRLPDGSRKYVEIAEAVKGDDGQYTVVPLYRFIATNNEHDENGVLTKIGGTHRAMHSISNNLADILLLNGANLAEIKKYAAKDWTPGGSEVYAI